MTPSSLIARLPAELRRLRLITGLTLFTYVSIHLLNHSLGIVSLATMEAGASRVASILHLPPVTWALYTALIVHFLLALWALYARRRLLAIPAAEAAQLLLGLSIIPLLAGHVVATRIAYEFLGVISGHTYIVIGLGLTDPWRGVSQAIALLVAWTHGCLGVFFWLRLKRGWPRIQPFLYAAALLLPVLALCGFYAAVREAATNAGADPGWAARMLTEFKAPAARGAESLRHVENWILAIWAAGLASALVARAIRVVAERRRGRVRIAYPDGRAVSVARGFSVLEASQLNGIAHAAVCGGRGRCSTCRVRISVGLAAQAPPSANESAVLLRIGASPNVRLACQLRPASDLVVVPLLPASTTARDVGRMGGRAYGQERTIAVLFADLRGFTSLSERRLPYDVVFVLNRYFEAVGAAIERAGGHVDKFIGDGVMALFGIDDADTEPAARRALIAAQSMAEALELLNATLRHDLAGPLRIGIGIHLGPAIIGEMGYGRASSLTAIGDTVNTASRVEALTKDYGAELVVSEPAARAASLDLAALRRERVEIRGRREPLDVVVVARAADLVL